MANPTKLNWTNPTTRVDGTPYTQADNAGYEIRLDGGSAVSIPLAFGTQFDLASLASYQSLPFGNHTVEIRAVSKGGLSSAFSQAATFPKVESAPNSPTAVSVT